MDRMAHSSPTPTLPRGQASGGIDRITLSGWRLARCRDAQGIAISPAA